MRPRKVHFLNKLLEEHQVPPSYKSLDYAFNGRPFYISDTDDDLVGNHQPFIATYISFPKFLVPTFRHPAIFKEIRIPQRNQDCYGMIIHPEIKNIDDYLNTHFNKDSRSPILKKKMRLEHCFHISYKVFYGHIDQSYYEFIMDVTHSMLIKRFRQRDDQNFILKHWDKYQDILLPLINSKQASFFVIYNQEEPIQVSINFHYGKTLFAFIPAYNIDYSQFGLGNTAIYKQLEWCIANHYDYLDMGNGDLDYKKRWCNYHYVLETHIYFSNKSFWCNLLAFKEMAIVKTRNALKPRKHTYLYKWLASKSSNRSHTADYHVQVIEDLSVYPSADLQPIDLKNNKGLASITKPIYDFLYSQQDHLDQLMVYRIRGENDTFVLKGSKAVKLTLQPK